MNGSGWIEVGGLTGAPDNSFLTAEWAELYESKEAAFRFAGLTIGRQAVSFGKAHFWNPLDVFLAFDPFQFDRDYKPGVDAQRSFGGSLRAAWNGLQRARIESTTAAARSP